MVRPRRTRHVSFNPKVTYFKPAGVPLKTLKEVILTFEELEAVRLIDSERVGQIDAGKKMDISQSTLSRLLKSAREKLAKAILNGNSIKIEGGDFRMVNKKVGIDNCVCPKCGYVLSHKRGYPCFKRKCPKCNSNMVRK